MDDDEPFKAPARAIAESAKALKVVIGGRELWVPKSVIHDDSEVFDFAENKEGTIALHGWFAREEGLEE